MKVLRPFLFAVVLAAGFIYFTSGTRWSLGRWASPGGATGPLFTDAASAASGFSADEQNNIDIYKSARDATVNITSVVYRRDWFFQVYPEEGSGSGFLIKSTGEILTNSHVVSGSSQLTVTLADKKVYKARVLGVDRRSDLALIKIDSDAKLPALTLGNSEGLVVGQKVLAIGNPFGLEGTLTTGIVSSLNRSIQDQSGTRLEGMIQTDAAINPGNSGGPLLDSHGNVIGINTAIYGSQGSIGIGFAMPINRAKAMLQEMESTGRVARPALGISVVFISGDLADMLRLPSSGGLLVQSVEGGSAAEAAGLRGPSRQVIVGGFTEVGIGGDLIVAIEGEPVTGPGSLQTALDSKRVGDLLRMTLFRNGRNQQVQVKLTEATKEF